MPIAKLSPEERHAIATALPGWTDVAGRDAIRKEFKFEDFNAAWGFMNRVALAAEKQDHHPDWFNVYNRVRVQLNTHDVGGVTELDMLLAEAMSAFAADGGRAQ